MRNQTTTVREQIFAMFQDDVIQIELNDGTRVQIADQNEVANAMIAMRPTLTLDTPIELDTGFVPTRDLVQFGIERARVVRRYGFAQALPRKPPEWMERPRTRSGDGPSLQAADEDAWDDR